MWQGHIDRGLRIALFMIWWSKIFSAASLICRWWKRLWITDGKSQSPPCCSFSPLQVIWALEIFFYVAYRNLWCIRLPISLMLALCTKFSFKKKVFSIVNNVLQLIDFICIPKTTEMALGSVATRSKTKKNKVKIHTTVVYFSSSCADRPFLVDLFRGTMGVLLVGVIISKIQRICKQNFTSN